MKTTYLAAAMVALLGVATFLATISKASPAQVILIRHGEKPEEGNELNARGRQRAQALVNYFKSNPAVTRYGTPVAIYAMGQHGPSGSMRPIQTVTPLAQSLGLNLLTSYTKNEVTDLAEEILGNHDYDGKMVLICWEHKMIPAIVQALGYANTPEFPDTYDRTWVLSFVHGEADSLQILPQALLSGDEGAPTP